MDCSLSKRCSRQEDWSGLSFPSPGDLPDPETEPREAALAVRFFTTEPPAKPTLRSIDSSPCSFCFRHQACLLFPGFVQACFCHQGLCALLFSLKFYLGLLRWLSGKESTYNKGDVSSIPGSGRSPGEGNGNPLQYSYLENPMDRGIWWAVVNGVTIGSNKI